MATTVRGKRRKRLRAKRLKVQLLNMSGSPAAPNADLPNNETAPPTVQQPQSTEQRDLESLNEQRAAQSARQARAMKDATTRFNLRAATAKADALNTKLRGKFPSSPLAAALQSSNAGTNEVPING